MALLDADVAWLTEIDAGFARERLTQWRSRLTLLLDVTHDRREREAVASAQAQVRALLSDL